MGLSKYLCLDCHNCISKCSPLWKIYLYFVFLKAPFIFERSKIASIDDCKMKLVVLVYIFQMSHPMWAGSWYRSSRPLTMTLCLQWQSKFISPFTKNCWLEWHSLAVTLLPCPNGVTTSRQTCRSVYSVVSIYWLFQAKPQVRDPHSKAVITELKMVWFRFAQ